MTDHTVEDKKSLIHMAYCTGPAQMDNWSPEGLLTTFFEAFYSVWNNVPRSQLPSAYVAHTPMLHTAAGQWCDATRNLKIIQIIRHPAAYLASELGRNRNKLPPENPASMRGLGRLEQRFLAYGGLTEAKRSQREKACIGWQIRHFLDRWIQAVNISLANEKQLGERYLTVRYEDIVERTLQTMEAVTQFLGISCEPIVLTPTIDGQPVWRGNSSFERSADDLDTPSHVYTNSIGAWRIELEQFRDVQVLTIGKGWLVLFDCISSECGSAMEQFGYTLC